MPTLLSSAIDGVPPAVAADFPITKIALQGRCIDEIRAHRKHAAYVDQAMEQGYPNIALSLLKTQRPDSCISPLAPKWELRRPFLRNET